MIFRPGGLFQHVGAPADDPADRERRGEQGARQAAQRHYDPGVELDVRVQFAARFQLGQDLHHPPLDGGGEVDEVAAEAERDVPQQHRTRVLRPVNGVPEAHDAVTGGDAGTHPVVDAVRGADLVEARQGAVGCAAVQRPAERAERGGDGRHQVRAAGGHHACGEGRGVEPVVHGGDQVLLDGPRVLGRRFRTGHEVQPVGCRPEVGARLERILPGAEAVQRGQDRRRHRADEHRVSLAALRIGVPQRWQVPRRGEHGQGGAQPGQGVIAGAGDQRQEFAHFRRQDAQRCQFLGEAGAFLGFGETALQEQEPDVLGGLGPGQVDGRVLPVVVKAFAPAHVSQLGGGDDDVPQSGGHVDEFGHSLTVLMWTEYCQY
ncbi:hypothetical protein FHX46_004673 [Amycolatopsis viridis]|uniref:Uncharacterized protein n=1 Tax=Amycolatopsis viridis TaxID=185678 RepID=A0ABX0SYU3_9PSEU|nr:hypothetical protein [Amycolatopsis viridis]